MTLLKQVLRGVLVEEFGNVRRACLEAGAADTSALLMLVYVLVAGILVASQSPRPPALRYARKLTPRHSPASASRIRGTHAETLKNCDKPIEWEGAAGWSGAAADARGGVGAAFGKPPLCRRPCAVDRPRGRRARRAPSPTPLPHDAHPSLWPHPQQIARRVPPAELQTATPKRPHRPPNAAPSDTAQCRPPKIAAPSCSTHSCKDAEAGLPDLFARG